MYLNIKYHKNNMNINCYSFKSSEGILCFHCIVKFAGPSGPLTLVDNHCFKGQLHTAQTNANNKLA